MMLKAILGLRGACLAAGLTFFSSISMAAQIHPALRVDVNGGSVTIIANDVPVRDIVEEIGMQSGIIVYSSAALDTPVTYSIEDEAIPRAIRRILKHQNFTLHYVSDVATGEPVFGGRLWILPDRNSAATSSWSAGEPSREWTLKYAAGDPEKNRLLAVTNLATEDEQSGVTEELLAAMNDPSEAVRAEVAYGLGELHEPAAVKLLKNALYDPDKRVRVASITALAESGDDGAAIVLSDLLSDKDESIRSEVIHALADIGGNVAGQFLQQALADSNEVNRETAADYLAEFARLALPE